MKNRDACAFMSLVLAVLLSGAGCSAERPDPVLERPSADVLGDVPLFPSGSPRTIAGTRESLEQTYESREAADAVASWYRGALVDRGWEIVSDVRAPDGSVTILAERAGAPLWILISPTSGGGSTYSVVGAAPDTVAR